MRENPIKISLEPRLNTAALDVNANQPPEETETYDFKRTPEEKLSDQILRIWQERKIKELTIESLSHSKQEEEKKDLEIDSKEPKTKSDNKKKESKVDLNQMRLIAHKSLEESLNEMAIAIDVVNVVSPARGNVSAPSAMPPGTISHTYHNKSEPSKQTQVQNYKLMLGAKRKQLNHAASILLSKAEKYEQMISKERTFWTEALSLRQKNWSIKGYGKNGGQLFVDYGYKEAGSLYPEITWAQIQRTPNDKQIAISFPPIRKRIMKLRLERRLHGFGDRMDTFELKPSLRPEKISGSNMHQQLLAAQSAVFELELFDKILLEASSLLGVKMIENEMLIPVYDNVDLTIQWTDANTQEESFVELVSPEFDQSAYLRESSTCTILKIAMNLLLRRHHRQNLENMQKKVLNSGQERIYDDAQVLTLPLHLLRYHFFCNKIREIGNRTIKAPRDGGVPVQLHFINSLINGQDVLDIITKANTIDEESMLDSLRVTLESPCTAVIHLAHSDLRTQDLHQFAMFMERELRLLLLKIIHKEIKALSGIKNSAWEGNWTVDRVMLVIVRPMPPVLTNQQIAKHHGVNLRRRRMTEITIRNDYPKPGTMAICVSSPGNETELGVEPIFEELVIGDASILGMNANSRRDFADRVHEFLIGMV
ncbi:8095_t:CDS:10 [Ambispora gerdemannii]|uniref:Mediator of RNA polymerase II transcription subunit 17 n=1 Tax=Ambispora gerdemannii TaxID=144530 RepID=A0A9N9F0S2_9GLOM|nr:8095_t:CDS:10 [Ambispora gerdemannii]